VLRLTVLLAAAALATSRIGLLLHELVGHGGAALAWGGNVTEVKLFWFAGGWIRYTLPERGDAAVLTIAVAGIALELLVGLALWLGVRGDSLGRRIIRGAGSALVVHGAWYLAVGTFHGIGDGVVLYRALGGGRVLVAVVAGVATCVATFLGARAVTSPLVRTLPGTARQRAVGFAIAALLGGGLHAALTIGEMRVRRDATYARITQSERDRRIAIELETWQRQQSAQGAQPDLAASRVERVKLERAHRTFPFLVVLAIAALLSLAAGAATTRGGADAPIEPRLFARAVLVAIASIAAVIVLDLLLAG